jgi:RsiW-degrading membrane proteinase PrsW (M82 family)
MPDCIECGKQVPTDAIYCPYCGHCLGETMSTEQHVAFSRLENMIREAFNSLIRPSPIYLSPSCSIYIKRPPTSLIPFAVYAIIFAFLGLFIAYQESWLRYLGLTIASFATPLIYLIWMFNNDRYEREPKILIAYIFGWGMFSAIFAGLFNNILTPFLGPGVAAFVEEPLKLFGVYLLSRNQRVGSEFNDHLDGMIYGAASGAGFAGLENFWYIFQMVINQNFAPFTAILIRSTTAFGHIAWTSIAGRSLGIAKVIKGKIELSDMIPGLIISIILHFVWNTLGSAINILIILPLTTIVVYRNIKTALSDESRWGYRQFAPNEHFN